MKRFDYLTPIGLAVGVVMLFFGIIYNGGIQGMLSFLDLASIIIVLGGVTAGIFISFPMKDVKRMGKVMKQAFSDEQVSMKELIDTFFHLSSKARREGLLSLEVGIEKIRDPFLRKGILLAVDGLDADVIVDILNAEIEAMEVRHQKGRTILEKAGEYAPSWGMIGTLIGLVLMLKNLNTPATLGPNMAIALLTTLYGSLLANLVFLPLAAKLENKTDREVFLKQIIIEGVIAIQSGQNPKLVVEKLSAYLSEDERRMVLEDEQDDESLED